MKPVSLALPVALLAVLTAWLVSSHASEIVATPVAATGTAEDSQREIRELREQIKHLESLLPDQAAVMTKVAYHFTNLYFAVQKANWPLAGFYLGETQNNIRWAVRTKPIRKNSQGQDIDLAAIAQAIDNTQFKDLKQAIAAKDKDRSVRAYDQTLAGCYACHTACNKPYLKPQRPTETEVKILNFDAATAMLK